MKAKCGRLYSVHFLLENYVPENPRHFGVWLDFDVGADEGVIGTNNFQILVCTPSWLDVQLKYEWGLSRWGRHMLIVREYDFNRIEKCVFDYVEKCTGKDFYEIAQKICGIARWEYDDCQQA